MTETAPCAGVSGEKCVDCDVLFLFLLNDLTMVGDEKGVGGDGDDHGQTERA